MSLQAFSTDHDDLPSVSSSSSDRFVFPPSPDFEVPSPNSPFDDDDEEDLPDDFVGVLYVGYPLRPSQACYDLVGLGLPSSVVPDYRRERFGELDLTSPQFDELLSSLVSPLRSKRKGSISFSYLNSSTASKSSRELYIIAEEDNEDWETPRSMSLPCIRRAYSQSTESPSLNERIVRVIRGFVVLSRLKLYSHSRLETPVPN
jgi:hypothetical protein